MFITDGRVLFCFGALMNGKGAYQGGREGPAIDITCVGRRMVEVVGKSYTRPLLARRLSLSSRFKRYISFNIGSESSKVDHNAISRMSKY